MFAKLAWCLLLSTLMHGVASVAHGELLPGGSTTDDRISVGYIAATGEVFFETERLHRDLEQLLILSTEGHFSGLPSGLELCDAAFCQDTDYRIEMLGDPYFSAGSYGRVAAKELTEAAVLADWTVQGRFYPSGEPLDSSQVDLIYVPEPSGGALLATATIGCAIGIRRKVRMRAFAV